MVLCGHGRQLVHSKRKGYGKQTVYVLVISYIVFFIQINVNMLLLRYINTRQKFLTYKQLYIPTGIFLS